MEESLKLERAAARAKGLVDAWLIVALCVLPALLAFGWGASESKRADDLAAQLVVCRPVSSHLE